MLKGKDMKGKNFSVKIKRKIKKFLPNFVLLGYYKVLLFFKSFWFLFFRFFPVDNSKIVFCCYYGKGYGDNCKYISEEILKREKKYRIVWLVKNLYDTSIPCEIEKVKYGSIKAIYELTTAKVWVDNCRKKYGTIKRKNQLYINTGHGGIPLKKVEKDADASLNSLHYVISAQRDSQMTDIMISHAMFRTYLMKNSYWYNGEVYECGIPKIEVLMKKDLKIYTFIREKYQIEEDSNIFLYAPTFRVDGGTGCYNIDFVELKKILVEKFGGRWYIFQRLHPKISIQSSMDIKDAIDVTSHPDMQELLMAADILLTDYSGTMFETVYTKKPVFLYAPDYETYDRGFYFNIKELPFPFATNDKELVENIRKFDSNSYNKEVDNLMEKLGMFKEPGAAKKIADRIESHMEDKRKR